MSEQDPRRWLKPEAPVDARLAELLEAGRGEQPSAAQLQALAQRLDSTFRGPGPGGGDGGGSGVATPLAPASAPTIAAAVAVAALLAAVALFALFALRGERSTQTHPVELGRASSALTTRAPEAVKAAELEPAPQPAPTTPQQAITHADAGAGAERVRERHDVRPRASARAAVPDSQTELSLLEDAQRALATDPKRALEATQAHADRFPHSQYTQERELLAIEALLRLNERASARARAERFLASYPGSSHVRRVRILLARSETLRATVDAGTR